MADDTTTRKPHESDGKRNIKGFASRKFDNYRAAWTLFLTTPGGLRDDELGETLGIDKRSAGNIRLELGATKTSKARYTLVPTAEDIAIAQAILKRAKSAGIPIPPRGNNARSKQRSNVPTYEILVLNATTETDAIRIDHALGTRLHHLGERRIDGLPVIVHANDLNESIEVLNNMGFETDEDGG